MSGASLMGLAVGLAAGAAAALLAAPMRGTEMRARLRSRADDAMGRGLEVIEQGRRALRTRTATDDSPTALTATLGEIAEIHSTREIPSLEARS
jgi:gas vesicle protein